MTKKALITGLTGQDGSYLAELLLSKGYQVFGLVRRSSSGNLERINHLSGTVEILSGDLLDQSSLMDVITESQPDEIYNLASQSYIPTSWTQPSLTAEYTALGVSRLLESIRRCKSDARFYQASSSEVFGQPDVSPQNELTAFRPRNPYGVAKAYAHWMTINYRQQYNLYTCCGITYTHESPRRGAEFVFRKITRTAAMIKLGLANQLKLGNLDAHRDWCYAKDAVHAMWLMLQQQQPDDYIIASGETHSVKELVECAFNFVRLNWQDYVVVDPSFYRPDESVQLVGNIDKIHNQLGWKPEYSFEQLVELMVDHDLKELVNS
ncbi:GDP-mannose 4,6-dehydratase [Aphanizomenon flos-aquae NRERC-008]|uniref:GDP-mannose 4,6-dehydratase n=1 Tax=Aphanizomenon flos-aquae FACHB-1249 TaxID=2692889 RepID=A0ABR8IVM3_APHFL|nr:MULTISPECIES: GDP-mannose 4,6-dehydratase [Aphanizomenon]MBD2391776.1 GDP-mannose 4,6-dehydratase [Aphanizomenon flos-aquae FACHB-1171]MBD2558306.1 GDP-mannose 4,6-dehydratase [Aphanizomenon flos-aquae FACHB-1290]MBD2632685.1 GDP-mannose 4,6-dehydratase [Aphanizomenon sp. FACHB-1399]MBD2643504.1 GDP-mannose 4,6-dehydratase [Aphanizomenon sp. FACHB-1401]MBD2659313.1 GDP-mannose 4,6-dehydratase [Aphanizomenon flos-aquae FACHB-1265]